MKKTLTGCIQALVFAYVMAVAFAIPTYAESVEYGPGYVLSNTTEPSEPAAQNTTIMKGDSLGTFSTTGYCNCQTCSGDHRLTYSGTVPQANHTISADLTIFPIGTQLIIGDIVYTVEDKGSQVTGNEIDIYFATHEEALAHGRQEQEVFAIISTVPKLVQ